MSFTVMLRSTFFPGCRARLGNRIPPPAAAFQACSEAIATWMEANGNYMELPTLKDVMEEHKLVLEKLTGYDGVTRVTRKSSLSCATHAAMHARCWP